MDGKRVRSEVVVFNGTRYHRYPDSSHRSLRLYFNDGNRRSLHRAIWESLHGPVPRGFHVHHKDRNALNNDPDNLEARDGREHAKEHLDAHREEMRRRDLLCCWCRKKFSSAASHTRFCSNRCKSAWRRASGVDDRKRFCVMCGKQFIRNRFEGVVTCSRHCASCFRESNRRRL